MLTRVAADQLVFTPVNMLCFLSSMAFLEGSSPRQRLRDTFWNALEKNWIVWPAVQAANFKLVPLEHRVLFVNVVALGWNCYLSHLNSHDGPSSKTKSHDQASMRPPAMQAPWTIAMVGLGISRQRRHMPR